MNLLEAGDVLNAAAAFEMYLARIPTDAEAQYNLVLAYFYGAIAHLSAQPWGDWELAKGISMTPQLPEPHARDIRRAKRLVQRAKTEVEILLQSHPAHAASWRLRGDIALASGDLSPAREHYRQALEYRPGDEPTQNNLGVLECLEKQWDKAGGRFQSCVAHGDPLTKSVAQRNLDRLGRVVNGGR